MPKSLIVLIAVFSGTTAAFAQTPKHPFHKNVKVTLTATQWVVESDGIPTHKTGVFPNRDNPNRITRQSYRFLIPRQPKFATKPTRLPLGPIGVAVNGIPFYNPYNREGRDAVTGAFAEVFDSCCGHPDDFGRYHYHKYPVCIKSPFSDPEGKHSPLIGYAFDGFPIYGPNDADGKPPTNLDECNGHSDAVRGYHYHVTAKFPYILGAYKGVVETKNFGGGKKRPPKRGFPPKGKRFHHPLEDALDADGDGVISSDEIRRASQLLIQLDRNRDGRLTPSEYRPKGPPPFGPPPFGPPK